VGFLGVLRPPTENPGRRGGGGSLAKKSVSFRESNGFIYLPRPKKKGGASFFVQKEGGTIYVWGEKKGKRGEVFVC